MLQVPWHWADATPIIIKYDPTLTTPLKVAQYLCTSSVIPVPVATVNDTAQWPWLTVELNYQPHATLYCRVSKPTLHVQHWGQSICYHTTALWLITRPTVHQETTGSWHSYQWRGNCKRRKLKWNWKLEMEMEAGNGNTTGTEVCR